MMSGDGLRALRKLHGWTQYDIMKATGFNRTKISEFENQHRQFTPEEEKILQQGIAKLFNKAD
jgi:transcriptional regulator with XRE-family HTH domain